MSDGTNMLAGDRVLTPIRWVMLTACLAAILFVSYGLAVRLPGAYLHWRLPIAIAAAGGVALLLAWPTGARTTRVQTADDVAVMLGIAALTLGIGAALLLAIGLAAKAADNLFTVQELIYRLTSPSALAAYLTTAVPAAITGSLGLAIARRRPRAGGRVSAAAVACRFSAVGLGCAILIAAAVAATALYRWDTWG